MAQNENQNNAPMPQDEDILLGEDIVDEVVSAESSDVAMLAGGDPVPDEVLMFGAPAGSLPTPGLEGPPTTVTFSKDVLVIPVAGGTGNDTVSQIDFKGTSAYPAGFSGTSTTEIRASIYNVLEASGSGFDVPVLVIGGAWNSTLVAPTATWGGGAGATVASIWIHPYFGRIEAKTYLATGSGTAEGFNGLKLQYNTDGWQIWGGTTSRQFTLSGGNLTASLTGTLTLGQSGTLNLGGFTFAVTNANKTLSGAGTSLGLTTSGTLDLNGFTLATTTNGFTFAGGTGTFTITSNNATARSLTVSTADKTLTGAGTTISIGGNLTTAAAFTQSGAFATTLTSTAVTSVTLPVGGTLLTTTPASNVAQLITSTGSQTHVVPLRLQGHTDAVNTPNVFEVFTQGQTVPAVNAAVNNGAPAFRISYTGIIYGDGSGITNISGTVITGVVTTDKGGTGLSSYTAGDMVYWASGTAFTKIPISGSSGKALVSSGTAPGWGAVSLANGSAGITGTLTVGNGGTGLASYTAGDIIYASGTTTLTTLAISGSSGKPLVSNGTAPTWNAISLNSGSAAITGTLGITNGGTGTATTPTLGQALWGNNTSGYTLNQIAVTTPITISHNATTGQPTIGVNASSANTNNFVVQRDGSGNFSASAITASSISLTSGTIATSPSSGTDIVNKNYVDSVAVGISDYKQSVRVGTTAALSGNYSQTQAAGSSAATGATITATANNVTLVIDGVTLALNQRVLVKNGITGTITANGVTVTPGANATNGIYTLTQLAATGVPWVLTRATDADDNTELTDGALVFIEEGTTNAASSYVMTTDTASTAITFAGGANALIVWTQFTGGGQISVGQGLTLIGSTIYGNIATTNTVVNQFDLVGGGSAGTAGITAGPTINTNDLTFRVSRSTNAALTFTLSSTSGTNWALSDGTRSLTVSSSGTLNLGGGGLTYSTNPTTLSLAFSAATATTLNVVGSATAQWNVQLSGAAFPGVAGTALVPYYFGATYGSASAATTSTANAILGTNATPNGMEFKTVSGTTNRLSVTHAAGSITFNIDAAYVGQNTITTLGTIGTGTWNASIIALAYGGTNANLTASNGGIVWSNATQLQILAGTATANQLLVSGASATPAWANITSLLTQGTGITITGTTNATIAVNQGTTFTWTAQHSHTYTPTTGVATNWTERWTSAPFAQGTGAVFELGATTAFDGSTAGFFNGSTSGTYIAINGASAYAGDFVNFGLAAGGGYSSKFSVSSAGAVTAAGAVAATGFTISGNSVVTSITASGAIYGAVTFTGSNGVTVTNSGNTVTISGTANTVTGTGVSTAVPIWSGTNTLTNDNGFFNYLSTNKELTLGTSTAAARFTIGGTYSNTASMENVGGSQSNASANVYAKLINTTFTQAASASVHGLNVAPVLNAAVTGNNAYGVYATVSTGATQTTAVSSTSAFYAADGTKSGTGAITIQHGLNVANLTVGTTNYGIRSQVTSGTNKWNLYIDGTAQNAIAGSTYLGGTSTPTAIVHLSAGGTAAGSAALKFTAGSTLSVAEAGAVEWDGTNLTIIQTSGTTRRRFLFADFSNVTGTLGVGNGGTGTATTFTQGSVVFAGASGVYTQDNTNFFWDSANARLGLGVNSGLTARLQVRSTNAVAYLVDDSGDSNTSRFQIDLTTNAQGVILGSGTTTAASLKPMPISFTAISSAAIAQYALVKLSATVGLVTQAATSDTSETVVGVAVKAAGTANLSVPIARFGRATVLAETNTNGAISVGDYVVLSTANAGYVMRASGGTKPSTGYIGRALTAQAGATTGQIDILLELAQGIGGGNVQTGGGTQYTLAMFTTTGTPSSIGNSNVVQNATGTQVTLGAAGAAVAIGGAGFTSLGQLNLESGTTTSKGIYFGSDTILYRTGTSQLTSNSQLTIAPAVAGSASLVVKSNVTDNNSTTVNIIEFQTSTGTVKARIDGNGNLKANSKSFDIPHPTQEGKRLVYGSLEGPEHGAYHRGEAEGKGLVRVQLPEYWSALVDEDFTVFVTPACNRNLRVVAQDADSFTVAATGVFSKWACIKFTFHVIGARKDAPLEVEQDAS